MFDWCRRIFASHDRRSAAARAGGEGERLAAEFLRRERGYALVACNWRNPRDRRGELDLVMRDGGALVFVEVKTRAAGALVSGYHAVDERKRDALRRAITAYLAGLRAKPGTVRFDVIEVSLAPAGEDGRQSPPEIHHFAGVPLFPPRWRP